MDKNKKISYLLVLLWIFTFILMGSLSNKSNYIYMTKINFVLQTLELVLLSFFNIKNIKDKNYILLGLNILLLIFYIIIFFLPIWGETLF